jgi:hypothetical protein
MVQNVREKGFMENKDLKENLISQAPNLRVSGVRRLAWSIGHRAWS